MAHVRLGIPRQRDRSVVRLADPRRVPKEHRHQPVPRELLHLVLGVMARPDEQDLSLVPNEIRVELPVDRTALIDEVVFRFGRRLLERAIEDREDGPDFLRDRFVGRWLVHATLLARSAVGHKPTPSGPIARPTLPAWTCDMLGYR